VPEKKQKKASKSCAERYWVDSNGGINIDSALDNPTTITTAVPEKFLQVGLFNGNSSNVEATVRNLNAEGLHTFATAYGNSRLTIEQVKISGIRSIAQVNGGTPGGFVVYVPEPNSSSVVVIRNSTIIDSKTYQEAIPITDDSVYIFAGGISGSGTLVMDNVTMDTNYTAGAVLWGPGNATIVSSRFINSGGIQATGGAQVKIVNSAFSFRTGGADIVDQIIAISDARIDLIASTVTLDLSGQGRPLRTETGGVINLQGSAVSGGLASGLPGIEAYFATRGGAFSADDYSWVLPVAPQDSAALKTLFQNQNLRTQEPGLPDLSAFYPQSVIPLLGTSSTPGALIDIIPNAQPGGANVLLHPITDEPILLDALGNPRVDGNDRRNIGAVQLVLAPHLAVTGTGPGEVDLAWSRPQDPDTGAITGYGVLYRPSGSSGPFSRVDVNGASVISGKVSGLVNGTEYEFQVVAVNAVGDGPRSNTVAATPFAQIGTPVITAQPGSQEVTLFWSEPDAGGHPGPLTYSVVFREKGSSQWLIGPSRISARTTTIPGLVNGIEYEFGVFAQSIDGAVGDLGTTTAIPVDAIVSYTGTSGDDNLHLIRNGTNIELWSGGTITVAGSLITYSGGSQVAGSPWPASAIQYVAIDGGGGSDQLVVDYTGTDGLEDVNVVFVDNDAPSSHLYVKGGATPDFGKVVYEYLDAHTGLIANFSDPAGISLQSFILYVGLAPITSSVNATNVVLDYTGAAETITVTPAAASGQTNAVSTLGENTTFNNPTGSLTIETGNGSGADTIEIEGVGSGWTTADLIIDGDSDDTISFQTTATNIGTGDLTADAMTISLPDAASDISLSGNGAASLTAVKGIALGSGASITTVDGSITLSANAAVSATGSFDGIRLTGATIQSTTGGIALTGGGGDAGEVGIKLTGGSKVLSNSGAISLTGSSPKAVGIVIEGGSEVRSTGSGVNPITVTLDGIGLVRGVQVFTGGSVISAGTGPNAADISIIGKETGIASRGISLGSFSGTGVVSSVDGDINLDGKSDYSEGVFLGFAGEVKSTTGDVTVNGTGGSQNDSYGDHVAGKGSISSNSGPVDVSGTGGGGTGTGNHGVLVSGSGSAITAATGDVSVTGTAGGGTGQYGVALLNGGAVTTVGGVILIDGLKSVPGGLSGDVQLNGPVSSTGANITIRSDRDIVGDGSGDISSGVGGGNIVITANQDGVGSPNDAGTIQTAGDVTAGTGTVTLSLTDCDGNMTGNIVSASDVVKNGSGALRLSGTANAYAGTTNVNAGTLLINGNLTADTDVVHVNNGGTLGGNGTIGSTPGARDVIVHPGGALDPGDVSTTGCTPLAGQLTINGDVEVQPAGVPSAGTFRVQLGGLTPGVGGYDQLVLNGTGNLYGAVADGSGGGELLVQPQFGIPVGAEFIIISNDPPEVIGTRFNNLPEGAFLYPGGTMMNISYVAGVGDNDVVLTAPGRFDFNGYNGYTADNYAGVSPFQEKTGSNSAGWQTLPPQWFERNYPVDPPYTNSEERLKYDGQATDNLGNPLTFETTVVSGKAYSVCILTGDAAENHDRQQFQVWDGSTPAPPLTPVDPANLPASTQIVSTWGVGAPDGASATINNGGGASNPSDTVGAYRWVCFTTDPIVDSDPVAGDGQGTLLMRMKDLGGVDPAAVILAMDIRPVETVGQLTITRTSPASGPSPFTPLEVDGLTVDTYAGTGAPPGATLTVTVSAPSATGTQYATIPTDGDTTMFGGQVTALPDGSFTFSVLRPATLAGNASPDPWTILVEEVSGLSRGTAVQPYTTPAAQPLRFDFGNYNSPVDTANDFLPDYVQCDSRLRLDDSRGVEGPAGYDGQLRHAPGDGSPPRLQLRPQRRVPGGLGGRPELQHPDLPRQPAQRYVLVCAGRV